MKILQGSNGKIQFWNAGAIQFSCTAAQNYRVVSNNEIHLISAGVKVLSIFADEITDIQIMGGAVTPTTFNNSQELAVSLDSNFFFDQLTISSIFNVFGETGDYTQTQSSGKTFGTSTALTNGTMYAVPIYLSGTITEFAMIKIGAAIGDFNFAIYEGDLAGGNPHIPLNKIYQSPENTFGGAQESFLDVLTTPQFFAPNLYFFGFQANSNLSFRGATTTLTMLGFSLTGTPDMSTITRYTSAVAYASTMPATFPAITKDLTNANIPLLFHKKQL
jgi:hypothetical protein